MKIPFHGISERENFCLWVEFTAMPIVVISVTTVNLLSFQLGVVVDGIEIGKYRHTFIPEKYTKTILYSGAKFLSGLGMV